MKLAEDRLILATGVDFDGTALGKTHVGVEFQVIDELALRGGVVLTDNFQDDYFTVGAGINVAGLYVDARFILEETLATPLWRTRRHRVGLSGRDAPCRMAAPCVRASQRPPALSC